MFVHFQIHEIVSRFFDQLPYDFVIVMYFIVTNSG